MPADALTTPERLYGLFHPKSVALVGATERSAWSTSTFANLTRYGEGIAVHCVSTTREHVHGRPAYRRLSDIGDPVDLAYVMVPTDAVLPVLTEAADNGIRHAVVLTSGFAEAGESGRALEAELVRLAVDRDLVILGPNGNGFINATAQVAPYGLPIAPPLTAGPVGIVLQSGGLASVVLSFAQAQAIGVSAVVAVGNEALVSATDVLGYLVADESTRAIAVFLEAIRDPAAFRAVAERARAAGKAIVALKVGRSTTGAQAALAHTGALVGDDAVVGAALRQLGVIRVDSLEDLLVTAGLLGHARRPLGRRAAVVTASGGASEIIADRAADEGIELPDFPASTTATLAGVLPAFSHPRNPLDVTGYVVVDPTLAQRSLEVVARDAAGVYDMVIYQASLPTVAPPNPEPLRARYATLAATIAASPVPVVIQASTATNVSAFARELLGAHDLHALGGIEHGMTALGHALRWQEWRSRPAAGPPAVPAARTGARTGDRTGWPAAATGRWSEHRTRALLERYGVPLVPATLVTSAQQAVAAAADYGGPVALKIVAAEIVHKSDIGGVRLDLRAPDDVAGAYLAIVEALRRHRPDVTPAGVLVVPMRAGGSELLVSVTRDPAWGLVLAVGLGGLWVEVLHDTALRLLPVGPADVAEMLGELRGAAVLSGTRGRPPADIDRVAAAVCAVVGLAQEAGEDLNTIEVNPLWVDGEQVEALDAVIMWQR